MMVLTNRLYLPLKRACFSIIILFSFIYTAEAQQWNSVETGTDSSLHSVYFVDRNSGWIVGNNGTILHTSDGGDSWNEQNSNSTENLNRVYFFDNFTGWIAGDNNLVLFTEDGGKQWSERRPSSVSDQHIIDISFADWRRGWVAGGPGGHIYYTDNSGITWQRQASLSADSTIAAIQFKDHTDAFAVYGNRIHLSEDNGTEWSESYLLTNSDSFSARDIYFVNDTLGWSTGNDQSDGIILRTDDGGKHWEEIHRMNDRELLSLTFTPDERGYVVGMSGTAIYTEDDGNTWNQISIETDADLYEVYMSDPGSGWIVGEGGAVFHMEVSETPDITFYENHYPSVRVADDSEGIDLFYRARQYGDAAMERDDPEKRVPYYGRLRGAMNIAEQHLEMGQNEYSSQIPIILKHFWAIEHNKGAEIYNESFEREVSHQQIEKARNHLKNATFIQPDSIHSHVSLAYINNSLNDTPAAISAMENALERIDVPKIDYYTFLIELYASEQHISRAIELNRKAIEHYPEESFLYETIVNLHLDRGEVEEAVNYLTELIDLKSDPDYYFVRGVQRQILALNHLEEALRLYEEVWVLREDLHTTDEADDRSEIENELSLLLHEVHELKNDGTRYANQAVSDMEQITEFNPDNHEAYGIMGSIHHNVASILYQMRVLTPDSEEAEQFDRRIVGNLENAKDHYERAVQHNPDESTYWEALYYIYLDLGLEEQAEQIVRREHIKN